MAPTETTVAWQTSEIVKYLLEDEHDVQSRMMFTSQSNSLDCEVETDGPPGSNADDSFDPVLIADKLRNVADALNDSVKFQAALTGLKEAAAQEAIEAAFSRGVDVLCQTQVCQKAEVASEMQLIKASVAFGLYVKKSSPELRNKVHSAMTAFLNRHVGPWVTQQGGWDKVNV